MHEQWKKVKNAKLIRMNLIATMIVIGVTLFLFFYREHISDQLPIRWGLNGKAVKYSDSSGYFTFVIFMYMIWFWQLFSHFFILFFTKKDIFHKELESKATDDDLIEAYRQIIYFIYEMNLIIIIIHAYFILCSLLVTNIGIWCYPVFFAAFLMITVQFRVGWKKLENKVRKNL